MTNQLHVYCLDSSERPKPEPEPKSFRSGSGSVFFTETGMHRWYGVIKIICDLFEIWLKTTPKDIRHGQKSVLEAQCTYKYDIFHCIYDRVAS